MAAPTPPAPNTCHVAVVMQRERAPNAWEDWRFTITEVLPDDGQWGGGGGGDGVASRTLRDDGRTAQVLHPGLAVRLHADEAEGYHLNLASGAPVWFVMWRSADDDPSVAWPELVTLSYHEAARLLDAQERVDNRPLDAATRDWLQAFTDAHHRPEPRQRRRPASFQRPEDR